MVELSLKVMEEWGHEGEIKPEHLREAYRRYRKKINQNTNSLSLYKSKLF